MNIRAENEKIVFEISIQELVDMQFNRDDMPYFISEINKMKKWLEKNFFSLKEYAEDDLTIWQHFLNNLFDYAYEHAEAWLQGVVLKKGEY